MLEYYLTVCASSSELMSVCSGGTMQHQHQDDRSGSTTYNPLTPQLGDRYYAPGQGPKEDHHTWNPHMASHEIHVSDIHMFIYNNNFSAGLVLFKTGLKDD